MTKDKKVLYTVSFLIFAVLLATLFIDWSSSKILAACFLLPLAIVTRVFIKKRTSFSISKKEVSLLSAIIGVLYVILVQLSGMKFGFYKNPYFISSTELISTILPLIVIIVSTEIIRSTLLAQKNAFASVSAFLSCIFAEILSFSNIVGEISFNHFMGLVGMTLFPAISANVYYHYASRRFGALPNIVFRIITTLYIYFLPSVTAMSDALLSLIKILLPIVMLALIATLFEKKKKNATQKGKKLSVVGALLTLVVIVSGMMLISCQFRFGALVIATESMTGEINKGDMIIYERYDDQTIKKGQVVVFNKNQNRIVHRVVEIEFVENEYRYYTKGDANESMDMGYITDADIVGLTDMKVSFIGFPTLWLRELLESGK